MKKNHCEHYQKLVREMMRNEPNEECEFDVGWVRNHGWKVVPVEDVGHFNPEQRELIVSALNGAGYRECVAVATEPLGEMPACFEFGINEADLLEFNRQCGMFRYLLTDESRTWAISCNEWYNLYAGEVILLESMLGKSIEQARQEFLEFATMLAKSPDDALLQVAKFYASL